MIKIRFVQLIVLAWCFCSCKGQSGKEETCAQKFKAARELAYSNPDKKSALDSALLLTNGITNCDSIKKAVVDFKITLLFSLQRYSQVLNFIDSLSTDDFTFNYKKNLTYKDALALRYDSQGDTVRRDSVYNALDNELERYIEDHNPSGKEFKAIYTELFAIKGKYMNSNQINSDVEFLKKRYPDKQSFFDFFKSEKKPEQ